MPSTLDASFSLPQGASLCILRLSAIGDVCHAVSMVSRIRRTRPDIRLTWVIGKIEHSLVSTMDGVEFLIYDKKGNKQSEQAFMHGLKKRRFDALCIMQVALRANMLSRHIKADIRLGFDKTHSKEGHSLFINKRIAPLHQPHVLEGFHAFADALGIPETKKLHWDIPIPQNALEKASDIQNQVGRYMVICPAASKLERSWSPKGYAGVAKFCLQKNITPVLCGGPGELDKTLEASIQEACSERLISYVGQTNLLEMLAILKGAEFVVSPDTGPAHMATSVNTPVIGLYAHSNPRRTGPYLSSKWVANAYDQHIQAQYGKPWDSLKWGVRAKGDSLMNEISEQQVCKQINTLLVSLEDAQ